MIFLVSSAGLKFVPTILPEDCAISYDLLKRKEPYALEDRNADKKEDARVMFPQAKK